MSFFTQLFLSYPSESILFSVPCLWQPQWELFGLVVFFQHLGVKVILMPFFPLKCILNILLECSGCSWGAKTAYIGCLFIQLPFLTIVVIWSCRSTGCLWKEEKLAVIPKVLIILLVWKSCVPENGGHQTPQKPVVHSSCSPEAS